MRQPGHSFKTQSYISLRWFNHGIATMDAPFIGSRQ